MVAVAFLVLLIGGALLFSSCSSPGLAVVPPLEIPGAKIAGNTACVDCHAPIARVFPGSVHARVHFDQEKMPGGTACESCHGPASRHVEAGGGRGKFIINPGVEPEACLRCHLETRAEFHLPHHHPVLEKKMNCVQCHDPHGSDIFKNKGALAMARLNENCSQCHREQSRPFVFEHEAMREGCVVCHNPHGSPNPKMLVARDSNLCLRCHAQMQGGGVGSGGFFIGKVDHPLFLKQGTCWTSGCHTAVHGSNVHPRMFY